MNRCKSAGQERNLLLLFYFLRICYYKVSETL